MQQNAPYCITLVQKLGIRDPNTQFRLFTHPLNTEVLVPLRGVNRSNVLALDLVAVPPLQVVVLPVVDLFAC